MSNLFWNLLAMIIGSVVTWGWTRVHTTRRRNERIRALRSVRSIAEIAICIRVGGTSDPLPDVRAFVRAELPGIKKIYLYDPKDEDIDPASPDAALRIIEDIYEGLRQLGEQQVTRVHLFNSGILAYVPAPVSVFANWCPIVIYYRTTDTYVALYEVEKGHRSHKRVTKPVSSWQVLDARSSV